MSNPKLTLSILPGKMAICRLEHNAGIPHWLDLNSNNFFSICHTTDELSIVCNENIVPDHIKYEKSWNVFKVEGPLDFSLTGILASLTKPLAQEGISIFAISTFDTDYILVKEDKFEEAKKALSEFCNINS